MISFTISLSLFLSLAPSKSDRIRIRAGDWFELSTPNNTPALAGLGILFGGEINAMRKYQRTEYAYKYICSIFPSQAQVLQIGNTSTHTIRLCSFTHLNAECDVTHPLNFAQVFFVSRACTLSKCTLCMRVHKILLLDLQMLLDVCGSDVETPLLRTTKGSRLRFVCACTYSILNAFWFPHITSHFAEHTWQWILQKCSGANK